VATSTETSRTTHLLALMKKGDDAFNDRDLAVLNEIHHPDMTAYVTGIFPDVHVRNDPYPVQFGSGDWITVVTRTTGTFTGEMVLPDGTVVPPTGKAFDLDFGQTSKWQGDELIAISAFWDSALQAKQIGLG
jgi:long-subunit fatty acid transport protein